MKILVAEDEELTRSILTSILQELGHEVIAVADGAEAWASLQGRPVQVIVSDLRMPNMDGLELCRKLRAARRKDYIYFILLTAMTGREHFRAAVEAGVDDCLTKAREHDDLMVRLRVAERILDFMGQVRELNRLLPICSYCRKVRDDHDYWQQLESYVREHTGSDFSHGICPECYQKHVQPMLNRHRDELDDAS